MKPSRLFHWALVFFLISCSTAIMATTSFDARYRVTSNQYSLAPSATIEHQLRHDQDQITSHMNASVRLARWEETAHLQLTDQGLESQDFTMYTRVIFSRQYYQLSSDDFQLKQPAFDRQGAIYYMATTAQEHLENSHSIILVEESGREEELMISVNDITELQGLEVAEIYFWKTRKPNEYTQAFLSTQYPGLLVFAQVHGSKGEKLLTFRLLDWQLLLP